ncbi:alpha/beta fold hydrolase [Variovorax sp. J22R133]|uniref:alpha/beta fold hydrolase n=1 Tax=Variovorax brevis TaxID=3053503 RepID=UPI002578316E|nr:alpha/beta fold hydrolase [Variovorax sp. J22R133]MDM0116574.1 alpha/beta fold hydrolase [Variovorax sp. J22R133]
MLVADAFAMEAACASIDGEGSRWITVPVVCDYRRGVVASDPNSNACGLSDGSAHAMTAHAGIRFCTSADGTRLAMAVSGTGSAVVAVRLWSAVEAIEAPTFISRHWDEALSRDFMHARYDARGIGLSERAVSRFTIDAWVEDLEAVVDALGAPTVALVAFSHAAAVAICFAARHPARVSRLAIYGGCARGLLRRTEDEKTLNAGRAMIQTSEAAYGDYGALGASFRFSYYLRWRPQFSREQLKELDAIVLDRVGKAGFPYTVAAHDLDVSAEARKVACPTLVVHAHDDAFIPFDEGRLMASMIPGARFISLATANHLPLETDSEWPEVVHELLAFLGRPTAASPQRDVPVDRSTPRMTPRQIEVLCLVGQGQTDKQMARTLGLSHRTVEMHVRRILEALSCRTRAEAIRIATERGLLD